MVEFYAIDVAKGVSHVFLVGTTRFRDPVSVTVEAVVANGAEAYSNSGAIVTEKRGDYHYTAIESGEHDVWHAANVVGAYSDITYNSAVVFIPIAIFN